MEELLSIENMGYNQIEEAADLLKAYITNRPRDWYDEGVRLAFNPASGMVFLINSDCQTLILEDGRAVMWYFLSYHGNEGTAEQLVFDYDNGNIGAEDWEQLADICEANGKKEKAEEIRERIEKEGSAE